MQLSTWLSLHVCVLGSAEQFQPEATRCQVAAGCVTSAVMQSAETTALLTVHTTSHGIIVPDEKEVTSALTGFIRDLQTRRWEIQPRTYSGHQLLSEVSGDSVMGGV